MIIIGTDIPLSARQLKRVLKRAAVGLVRTGSYMGHGSGDVFIGFTNENYLPAAGKEKLLSISCFPEDRLDLVFRMAAESVEEAICNSLIYAHQETGVDGKNLSLSQRIFCQSVFEKGFLQDVRHNLWS